MRAVETEGVRERLPDGWCWSSLQETTDLLMGQSPPGETYNVLGTGLPFFQGKAEFGELYPEVRKWCTAPNKTAQPGDVLISVRAPVGPTNLADRICAIGRGLSAIRPIGAASTGWLLYWLRFQEPRVSKMGSGTTFTAIARSDLADIELPVAPIAEQQRIVAAVDALLQQVNAARARLGWVREILKRFRQAVLTAACSGVLTEDWRASSQPRQSASELLQRIEQSRHEKRRGTVTSLAHTEPAYTTIPDSWAWTDFGSVIGELKNGVPTQPRMEPPGIPILRIGAVRSGAVELEVERFLPNGEAFLPDYRVRDGDLLFTRYNGSLELVGVCGMVRGLGDRLLLYPDKLIRVRFDHPYVLPAYAELFFATASARRRLTDHVKSTAGQKGISGATIRQQVFLLPPVEEQREIVRRVEALFALVDRIEQRVAAASARAERLTQTILAKAFRGELVPTEAELARREGRSYEPASALLERVRREREAAGVGGNGKGAGRRRRAGS